MTIFLPILQDIAQGSDSCSFYLVAHPHLFQTGGRSTFNNFRGLCRHAPFFRLNTTIRLQNRPVARTDEYRTGSSLAPQSQLRMA